MKWRANLLVSALIDPAGLLSLQQSEWGQLIREAKWANLLARVDALFQDRGLINEVPPRVKAHLVGARRVADNEARLLCWEVNRIQRALRDSGIPFVLLKGAAYIIMDLPIARGRISSDVDILLPKEQLNATELSLLEQGWERTKLDDYDQYFYRRWSHELPPLRHRERGTIVDIHHAILPPTSRLHPDPEKLLASAVKINGTDLRALAPVDMVLHSAAHAFHDGDLRAALRDLVDLDGLFRHFGTDQEFWKELFPRARELQLARPLHYALRYTKYVLNTPMPEQLLEASQVSGPLWPVAKTMDRLLAGVLRPRPRTGEGFADGFSSGLLYIRSHWLRMAPWLLARHLLRKFFFRKRNA